MCEYWNSWLCLRCVQALRCYSRHKDAQTDVWNASVDGLTSGSVDTRVHAEQAARDRLCCSACVCIQDAQAQNACVCVCVTGSDVPARLYRLKSIRKTRARAQGRARVQQIMQETQIPGCKDAEVLRIAGDAGTPSPEVLL